MSNDDVKLSRLVLSLGLISCFATGLMVWVFVITEAPISAAQQRKNTAALSQVLPAFDKRIHFHFHIQPADFLETEIVRRLREELKRD